jgi:hypothetical protein
MCQAVLNRRDITRDTKATSISCMAVDRVPFVNLATVFSRLVSVFLGFSTNDGGRVIRVGGKDGVVVGFSLQKKKEM